MKIDNIEYKICMWYELSKDPNSTTFEDVTSETHTLYKCKTCSPDYFSKCRIYDSIKKYLK